MDLDLRATPCPICDELFSCFYVERTQTMNTYYGYCPSGHCLVHSNRQYYRYPTIGTMMDYDWFEIILWLTFVLYKHLLWS